MMLIFINKSAATISDSLFMTVGNIPITKSDMVNEIKLILILNNESYAEEKREELQSLAVKSIVKRSVKQIELERHDYFKYSENDLQKELIRIASLINVDLETLKSILTSNELNFTTLEDQIKLELHWNSLIFQIYKNRISVNPDIIEEKLKLTQDDKTEEYLVSEILIKPQDNDNIENEIKKLKEKIAIEGFETVAKNLSISESATRGGNLGWINENVISEEIKNAMNEAEIGSLSKPVLLDEGILIFTIRDKREIKDKLTLEQKKNQLVNAEKTKVLTMYSLSHYDKVRRTIAIKFFNE